MSVYVGCIYNLAWNQIVQMVYPSLFLFLFFSSVSPLKKVFCPHSESCGLLFFFCASLAGGFFSLSFSLDRVG